jgi:hypothetical protein
MRQVCVAQRRTLVLGSQLGAEALKRCWELRILGLDVSPYIVVLVVMASAMFSNSNTSLC